jgi:hypothetical protein
VPDWIIAAQTEHIHVFLAIAAKEITSTDLLGSSQSLYCQRTHVFIESKCSNPSMIGYDSIAHGEIYVERPGTVPVHGIQSALKCSQAWMNRIPIRFVNCFICLKA